MLTKEKIAKAAFGMFRDWRNEAKRTMPELVIEILDETKLVESLGKSIRASYESLTKEHQQEKRAGIGYDIGFVQGFICGNINAMWYNEYVIKQSKAYKEFLVFKSIKIYLELFETERLKINKMYSHLYFDDLNVYQDISIDHEKLKLDEPDLDSKPEDDILIALNNRIIGYTNDYLNSKTPFFLDSVEGYFTEEDIIAIINNHIEEWA